MVTLVILHYYTAGNSVAAKGIFQSPITSCSRKDHSVCQASANSILKMQCVGCISVRILLQRTDLA